MEETSFCMVSSTKFVTSTRRHIYIPASDLNTISLTQNENGFQRLQEWHANRPCEGLPSRVLLFDVQWMWKPTVLTDTRRGNSTWLPNKDMCAVQQCCVEWTRSSISPNCVQHRWRTRKKLLTDELLHPQSHTVTHHAHFHHRKAEDKRHGYIIPFIIMRFLISEGSQTVYLQIYSNTENIISYSVFLSCFPLQISKHPIRTRSIKLHKTVRLGLDLAIVLFLAACFNFSFSLVSVWSCHFSFISFSHVHTLFSLVKFQSTKSLSILVFF